MPLAPVISLGGAGEGVVQFGSASPVNLIEARIRADEYARRLAPFERGDYRPVRSQRAVPALSSRGLEEEQEGNGTLQGLGMTFR